MITRAVYDEAKARSLDWLERAGIVITEPEKQSIEVADFGLSDLDRMGLEVLVYVNTQRVCAKELVLFPNQTCPEHRHPTKGGKAGKEETFRCRWGTVHLYVPGAPGKPRLDGLDKYREYLTVAHEIVLRPGDQYTLMPDTPHWFQAGPEGAIVSEFSTRSTDEADRFSDPRIARLPVVAEA